jgi:RNA polymerase sigma factor (TIGR02999 family)
MSDSKPVVLTLLIHKMREGDADASNRLIELVYSELKRLATNYMRREREGHTLQTTALVHEAYMRLAEASQLDIKDRQHFFALAASQMRRILVDKARSFKAEKHGGGQQRFAVDEIEYMLGKAPDEDLVAVHEALEHLALADARAAKVVELRFFGGLTDHEVAETLDISFAMVRRDWEFARAFLLNQLGRQARAAGAS